MAVDRVATKEGFQSARRTIDGWQIDNRPVVLRDEHKRRVLAGR